jgi:two-component sensor histidine kinase
MLSLCLRRGGSGLRASVLSFTSFVRSSTAELEFRLTALRLGSWIGWIAILVVVTGLSLHASPRHVWLLLGLTVAAAAGNALAMRVPWRSWLASRRGPILLDLWSGALIGFIAVLVIAGGSSFTLLLFLALPFIAVIQVGWRRPFWLVTSLVTCSLVALSLSLPLGPTAMRLGLVAAVVGLVVVLARAVTREAAARQEAAAQAELERTLASEAHHRIKNSLQTVADLLLLGRPSGGDYGAFDESATRIRSIASVHRLLAQHNGAPLLAGSLLESIADGAPQHISVEADPIVLEPAAAQKLGIVANELIANALRHGTPPIAVRLTRGRELRLSVEDGGRTGGIGGTGLGLGLVRRIVEHGLGGSFVLNRQSGGGTRAEVVIPAR